MEFSYENVLSIFPNAHGIIEECVYNHFQWVKKTRNCPSLSIQPLHIVMPLMVVRTAGLSETFHARALWKQAHSQLPTLSVSYDTGNVSNNKVFEAPYLSIKYGGDIRLFPAALEEKHTKTRT